MRVGLLSDIHGNLHALRAGISVLSDSSTDSYVVAGDIVGYGAQPNECVELVGELPGLVAVAGNHELLVRGVIDGAHLPRIVTESITWTRERLTSESLSFLERLPTIARIEDVVVAHGSLGSVSTYVSYAHQARSELGALGGMTPAASILILGHTHVPWVYADRGGTQRMTPGLPIYLDPTTRHLVNPGSVGQSRQREQEPLVRFAQLDLETRLVTFWALTYDTEAARRSLRQANRSETLIHLKPSLVSSITRPARRHLSRVRRKGGTR